MNHTNDTRHGPNLAADFDLINVPLKGSSLIEASAGTGKTYSITGLLLRLLLEKQLEIEKILVVTYTEAATEELKSRIRKKLRDTLRAFRGQPASGGNVSDDPLLTHLFQGNPDGEKAGRALEYALQSFDQASIFTIHGFCKRILEENAFESGVLFDTELVTDTSALTREAVEDFWREHVYSASPLFAFYLMDHGVFPDTLSGLLGSRISQPYATLIPEVAQFVTLPDTHGEEQAFMAAFDDIRRTWDGQREFVIELLSSHKAMNHQSYKKSTVPKWAAQIDEFITARTPRPWLFDALHRFSSESVMAAVKPGHNFPGHPFFDLCQILEKRRIDLSAAFCNRLIAMRGLLLRDSREKLRNKKKDKNIQTFDDLLLNVRQALASTKGPALIKAVRSKFKAVLIDEFQDTDPIQYGIFSEIFGNLACPFFLIGDPKQAIYSFRGADIFAYIDAAANAGRRYTMGVNWRSVPRLVHAVNTIFERHRLPFVYEQIEYRNVMSSGQSDSQQLTINGSTQPPFQLWLSGVSGSGNNDDPQANEATKTTTKACAVAQISAAVASEISRLLHLASTGCALIGTKPIGPQDIAVLVRWNAEALLVQRALSDLGIPSVLYGTQTLFETREAVEVSRILAAICRPHDQRLARAALSTEMWGLTGDDLGQLANADVHWEQQWEQWLLKFRSYHDQWLAEGFIQMFRRLLNKEDMLPRLMSLDNAERRATNVMHLAEALHKASMEEGRSMDGLLKWLTEQMTAQSDRKDEYLLRLESDSRAVKIVTIHKSKGLEYPIVFCPFLWDESKIKNSKQPFPFHDPSNNMQLTIDLATGLETESPLQEEHLRLAQNELLAENVRLAYVALTRAKFRCYAVWGRISGCETSALAYLLHTKQQTPAGQINMQDEAILPNDWVRQTSEAFNALSDSELINQLREIESLAQGAMQVVPMPEQAGHPYKPSIQTEDICVRTFDKRFDRSWTIASFSSLVASRSHEGRQTAEQLGELRDHDFSPLALENQVVVEDQKDVAKDAFGAHSLFLFPAGPHAGTFMHDVLENVDFALSPSHDKDGNDSSDTGALVLQKLAEYGFEASWQSAVCQMVQNVLKVPLCGFGGGKKFSLSVIPKSSRIHELEFHFPLKILSPKTLERIFLNHLPNATSAEILAALSRLDFDPRRGFMRGYIDLVFEHENRFYIVDWKSNLLGMKLEDYNHAAMTYAMTQQYYFLQYHIYTLALDRYLNVRLAGYNYDSHFGGIYYIFLRGVDAEKGPELGVYSDRPSAELIEALTEYLVNKRHTLYERNGF